MLARRTDNALLLVVGFYRLITLELETDTTRVLGHSPSVSSAQILFHGDGHLFSCGYFELLVATFVETTKVNGLFCCYQLDWNHLSKIKGTRCRDKNQFVFHSNDYNKHLLM